MDCVLVFVAALTFYGATLAPTIIWGDSVWYAVKIVSMAPISFGTAGDHPLFLLLGRVFTAFPGEPARNLNVEAACFGALTVMLVYVCARQLGTSRLAAGIGAAALCVSHAFWTYSVMAEVYTANAFFVVATLCLVIEWKRRKQWRYILAALAVFALGLTNHLVLAALVPAIGVFVVATHPRLFLTRGFMVALTGGIFALVALAIAAPPSVSAAIDKLWVGPPGIRDYFNPNLQLGSMAREAGFYALYLGYQFPSMTLVLGVLGIRTIVRDNRGVSLLLLLAIAVNAGIFIHHTGWKSQGTTKFVFYISDYAVFAILGALGAEEVLRRLARRQERSSSRRVGFAMLALAAVAPPVFYAIIPKVAHRYQFDLVHATTIPYRDNQEFFLNPNKHGYDGARRFGEEAMRAAKPSAVIFADYTPAAVLSYLQTVEGVRPDVLLRFAKKFENRVRVEWVFIDGQRRPTYIASSTRDYYDFTGLTGGYDLAPAGPIIEVRPRGMP